MSPKHTKRKIEAIDLTGSDSEDRFDVPARKLTKALKPSSQYNAVPVRSEGSLMRWEEDGGNEMVDEIDQSQGYDDRSENYELYGVIFLSASVFLYSTRPHH